MLYNLLLALLILDGLILSAVVLLQAGQGGGLASMGGGTTDLVLGGRQAVTILHKTSWITGGVFMVLSFLLSMAASNRAVGESEVQRRLRQPAPTQQALPAAPLQTAPGPAPGVTTPPAAPAPVPPPAKP
ncbi:MAG: preprotein translocase subunit SecG [Gemmatimonadales bacterium]|nr:preprotein translocase subunit SecG [Gemmatimonadales bacterium]